MIYTRIKAAKVFYLNCQITFKSRNSFQNINRSNAQNELYHQKWLYKNLKYCEKKILFDF